MLAELPYQPLPEWIAAANASLHPLPIQDMLAGSVYYPACEFDGNPVKYLGGNYHSFIYVDYGVGRDQLIQNLNRFRGYRVFASRDVTEQELTPNGCEPQFSPSSASKLQSKADSIKAPFGIWTIYERLQEYSPNHGPDRFSLLYIGGDGVATFQALYHGNNAVPALVAVIQPGHGFGHNWTNFESENGIFARSVMGNPCGVPEFLLFGGWGNPDHYQKPCWTCYNRPVAELDRRLRLWTRTREPSHTLEPPIRAF